jgi:hypothetical protein
MNKTSIITGESIEEGPMWNNFWNSTFSNTAFVEPDRLSQYSDSRTGLTSSALYRDRREPASEILPSPSVNARERVPSIRDSISAVQNLPVPFEPDTFTFKFKDVSIPNGKIFRLRASVKDLKDLYKQICTKTGYKSEFLSENVTEIGPNTMDIIDSNGVASRLCYIDDEGDIISIECDKDLQEAVNMCIAINSARLAIYLGEPTVNTILSSRASTPNSTSMLLINNANLASDSQKPEMIRTAFDSLRDAPLAVNVAISAAVVVLAYYVMRKISP